MSIIQECKCEDPLVHYYCTCTVMIINVFFQVHVHGGKVDAEGVNKMVEDYNKETLLMRPLQS